MKNKKVESPKIMLVDDDEMSLESLYSFLTSEGYDVDAFQNPKKALECISNHQYELILTDYSMPQMTGIQLIKSIRKTRPEIFTILFSGFFTEALKKELYIESNIDKCITKPVRIHELLPLINEIIKTSSGGKNE